MGSVGHFAHRTGTIPTGAFCAVEEDLEFLAAPLAREIRWRIKGHSDRSGHEGGGQLVTPECSCFYAGFIEEAYSRGPMDTHFSSDFHSQTFYEPHHVFMEWSKFCIGSRIAHEKNGRCS